MRTVVPVRVLIAPDKFKGSATAREVAEALSAGFCAQVPDASVRVLPLADGGDGSVEAALSAGQLFSLVKRRVAGPFGGGVEATLAFSRDARRAVVEVANTCGLGLVANVSDESARAASSRGFGQALAWAIHEVTAGGGPDPSAEADAFCPEVVAAIGGSSSTDGGAGLLHELGLCFFDVSDRQWVPSGGDLHRIARVGVTEQFTRVREALVQEKLRIVVASDVTNPLLGEHGAAAVFGPQKGASAATVRELDAGLAHFVSVLDAVGFPASTIAQAPGAGAAGGIGFALMLAGAELVSGADFFLDLLNFDTHAAHSTLVVTGEGSFDQQTLGGKLPAVVAQRAARANPHATVTLVAGVVQVSAEDSQAAGFAHAVSLTELAGRSTANDPAATREALTSAGKQLARMFAF